MTKRSLQLAAFAAFIFAWIAAGVAWQWTSQPEVSQAQSGSIAAHAVPISKGPGVTGYGAAPPGTLGWVLASNGPSADPTFQAVPLSFATQPQYYQGTLATAAIPPSIIYPPETTTTFGATTAFDFSTFINTSVTLTANMTTMTVANVKAGQAGSITFIQDGTGNRTIASGVWNTVFKFSGGTKPTLSTAANAVDVLAYYCRTATYCTASLVTNVQ